MTNDKEDNRVIASVLADAIDAPLTFLASIAPLQSAIQISSDGGARVKIDIPEDEMAAIVRLLMLRGKTLRFTVIDDGATEDRTRYFSH